MKKENFNIADYPIVCKITEMAKCFAANNQDATSAESYYSGAIEICSTLAAMEDNMREPFLNSLSKELSDLGEKAGA